MFDCFYKRSTSCCCLLMLLLLWSILIKNNSLKSWPCQILWYQIIIWCFFNMEREWFTISNYTYWYFCGYVYDTFIGTFPNGSRVLLLLLWICLSRYIHTDAAVKTFIIRLQGLFGMSKSSLYVCFGMSRSSLHVSHLDVRTDAAVKMFMIRLQGPFRNQFWLLISALLL